MLFALRKGRWAKSLSTQMGLTFFLVSHLYDRLQRIAYVVSPLNACGWYARACSVLDVGSILSKPNIVLQLYECKSQAQIHEFELFVS